VPIINFQICVISLDCDLQLTDKFGKIYQTALAVLNKLLLVVLKERKSWFEGSESVFGILNLTLLNKQINIKKIKPFVQSRLASTN
jgi:hypothetical protein